MLMVVIVWALPVRAFLPRLLMVVWWLKVVAVTVILCRQGMDVTERTLAQ